MQMEDESRHLDKNSLVCFEMLLIIKANVEENIGEVKEEEKEE